ncbi:hypothetical protein LTR56_023371 [Elasticomyces elasticus]|nr:hypothetical protein LTR56_023371 [Elasticomyces elasticus]KAK3623924.1 hypothetical protein LTR22_024174 [Elasticomyces elasticus]KAK4906246.1 hypothetical protein LTR49_024579 [Elasticomyces elasticus]
MSVLSPKEETGMGQTRLIDVGSIVMGPQEEDSDSASNEESSSPLMRKTNRRRETSGARGSASKASKVRTLVRSIGSTVEDPGVKAALRRRERPKDTIRNSYTNFGLDASRLTNTHEPHITHPLALYMGSTAKTQSKMTHGRSKKLRSARDDLLAYISAARDSGDDRKNIDLYNEALEGWSKHDIERIHIYDCLVYVLLHLVEEWRGLHLLVLVFLRKSSILHVSLRARIAKVQ